MSGYPEAIRTSPVRIQSSPEVRSIAAFLLPSFGVMVFAVTLLEVVFLSHGAPGLLRDSDTGWHIRNGEAILQTFAVPSVDPYSYTRGGEPWLAWEWLTDAIFGGAHRTAGLAGVTLLSALVIAATVWAVAALSLSLGANLFVTAGSVVLMLAITSMHWLARPHLFSWLFALLFLAAAEHERRGQSRSLFLLPVVACLWANMHGSFLLGPGILFVYALGEMFARQSPRRFGVTGMACLFATLINPYGWRLHEHVISVLRNSYVMDHVAEFRSFDFHSQGAYNVELFLFIAIVAVALLLRQRAYAPALLGIAILHISFYSARHLPLAAVFVLPFAGVAITREARESRRFARWLDYSDRLRAIDRRILGTAPFAIVLLVTVGGLTAAAKIGAIDFDSKVYPVQAANFLEKNNSDLRVFSSDQWGGYLIYRFAGSKKVFIDGRGDFYGQDFLQTYALVADVKPSWNEVLKQYRVGLVLIPPDCALASVMQISPEWRRVYSDSVASIFERVS